MSDQRPQDPTDGYFVTVGGPAADEPHLGTPDQQAPARSVPRAVLVAAVAVVVAAVVGIVLMVRSATLTPEPRASEVAAPALTQSLPGGGTYAVWARNHDGTAVRWNPCEPIRWVMNLAGAPDSAHADVLSAVDRISEATGLEFRFAGFVDEPPAGERSPFQPDRYGTDRWAPVLVAWADEGGTEVPLSTFDRAVAIPVAVGAEGERVYVSGQVVFGTSLHLRPGFEDRHGGWGATILHELGHLVGLDHVDDEDELMFPYPGRGPGVLGAGDLAGLAAVGAAGGCLDTPPARPVEVVYEGASD